MAPDNPHDLIGKELGPCRIEALLGAGGMGLVYRGTHLRLNKPVAVKVILPSIQRSTAAEEQLLNEARLAASLEDPHIIRVYDVGREGHLSYIVMQLVLGETLADRIARQGKLSQPEALAIMKEVIAGLRAAHKQGIVHRDLKPANIMIDEEGAVKLMDFGLAATSGKEDFSPDASFSGSFDFMSPEQAFSSKPDPRMDLYAFGTTYFFALTGRAPYTGQNAVEILLKHRDATVPDVREFNREVTPAAAALLSRLMQKFPEARPSSADEVIKELDSPGMIMEIDPSGSPFKILPPPVAAQEGLAAELQVLGMPQAADLPSRPMPMASGLPPPPPAVAYFSGKIPTMSWIVASAIFIGFFAGPWSTWVPADWMAAGIAATVWALGLIFFEERNWARMILAPALMAGAFACFFIFGARPGEAFPPPMPEMEILVLLCLTLILAGAGVYLGGLGAQPERGLAVCLLAASGVVALWAAMARGLPDSISWVDGLKGLFEAACSALWNSGGFWRWSAPAVLYGAYRFARFSRFDESQWCRNKTSDGRVINWNK